MMVTVSATSVAKEVMRRMMRVRALAALIVGALLAAVLVVPATADAKSLPTTAVYRFYNQGTGAHFYTGSVAERDHVIATWSGIFTYEGPAFYLYDEFAYDTSVDPAMIGPEVPTTPVHRFYNVRNGSHFYTTSAEEADHLRSTDAKMFPYDGVGFQAYSQPSEDLRLVPVYRFYHKQNGSHFYTISPEEKALVQIFYADTYRFEGVAFYAMSGYVLVR
jgi:hypothetical protein